MGTIILWGINYSTLKRLWFLFFMGTELKAKSYSGGERAAKFEGSRLWGVSFSEFAI